MIIFLIVIVLLVLSIVGAVLIDCDFHECLFQVLIFAIGFLAVVAIVMCAIIMFANINYKGYILSMNAEKEAIEYQLDNQTYLNDNNVGANEVFSQAGKFNEKVLSGTYSHSNSWTSWFHSPAYQYIEPIDLKK